MAQNKYTVLFKAGQEETVTAESWKSALILACANQIHEGNDYRAINVHCHRSEMNYEVTEFLNFVT